MHTDNPVIGFKLMTGDDVLAYARFDSSKRVWILNYPGLLISITNQAGNPAVGVTDYIPFTENKQIEIDETKVLFTYRPDNEMELGYVSKFDSVEIPAQKNIVPFVRK